MDSRISSRARCEAFEFPPQHFPEDNFETGYIQHSVVQPLGKFWQVLVDELSILSYRVATDTDGLFS